MVKKVHESRMQVLELQLEEAVQMLRLVARNDRTCLEVEEWLKQNHPDDQGDPDTVSALMGSTSKRKIKPNG
jgi:hypothetical protein